MAAPKERARWCLGAASPASQPSLGHHRRLRRGSVAPIVVPREMATLMNGDARRPLRSPWGAQTRSSSRGLVFVEESAEEVVSSDLRRVEHRCGRRIGSAAMIRRSQVERSVWTLLVEVADVDAEDVLELTGAEDRSRSRHSLRTLPTQRSA
jgi:hypothetical protein